MTLIYIQETFGSINLKSWVGSNKRKWRIAHLYKPRVPLILYETNRSSPIIVNSYYPITPVSVLCVPFFLVPRCNHHLSSFSSSPVQSRTSTADYSFNWELIALFALPYFTSFLSLWIVKSFNKILYNLRCARDQVGSRVRELRINDLII